MSTLVKAGSLVTSCGVSFSHAPTASAFLLNYPLWCQRIATQWTYTMGFCFITLTNSRIEISRRGINKLIYHEARASVHQSCHRKPMVNRHLCSLRWCLWSYRLQTSCNRTSMIWECFGLSSTQKIPTLKIQGSYIKSIQQLFGEAHIMGTDILIICPKC